MASRSSSWPAHEELMALDGLYVLLNEQQRKEKRSHADDPDVATEVTA